MSISLKIFCNLYRVKKGYTCPFMLDRVPNCHKTLETHEKAVSRKPFLVKIISTNINLKI